MLDLTTLGGNAYEIKLLDGKVYHLKRPTQALFKTLLGLQELTDTNDTDRLIAEVMGLLLRVLNRNAEGVEFTQEQLDDEGYDFIIAMTVLTDYLQHFSQEITDRVDFPTTQQ